tara:strand:- start:166 stop:645 length:480 start_codon:yes stop_codon:yes gene_type:complete
MSSSAEGIRPGPRGGKRLALLLLSEKGKYMGAKAEDADEDIDHNLPRLPSGAPLKVLGRRSPTKSDEKVVKKKNRPKAKDNDSPLEKSMRLNKRFIDPKYHYVHEEADDNGKHKGTFADADLIHTTGVTLLTSKDHQSTDDPLKTMNFDYIEKSPSEKK